MKAIHRLLCSFLAVTLTIPLVIGVNASEPTKVVDGIISVQDIPNEVIQNLPHGAKLELQGTESTVISVNEIYTDFDSNQESDRLMPTSDFKLTVVAARMGVGEAQAAGILRRPGYKFTAVGQWIVNPNYEFTDCMSLCWSDGFSLAKEVGYTYSYNTGKLDFDSVTLNKIDNEAGIAYDVDLKLFDRQDEIVLSACVAGDINIHGTANISTQYAHSMLSLSKIHVSFKDGQAVFTVGGSERLEYASPSYAYFEY